MNPYGVIVKILRKDSLKKNSLWEKESSENSSQDERKLFESATEPIQNSGTQSKELLIGHGRRGETTRNSLGALSENELYSASNINQEISSWDILLCN